MAEGRNTMPLTPKQEAFCLAFIETGNASEAYRRSYNSAAMKPATVNRSAKELLDHPKISARLEDLRADVVERAQITVKDLLEELEEARVAAMRSRTPQAAAATAATMGKAKLLGFLTDRVDATVTTKALPASVDDFV